MDIPMAGAPPSAPPTNTTSPQTKDELDSLVQSNDIVLFMKGSPEAPQCGFSNRAAQALLQFGHPFKAIDVFTFGDDPRQTVQTLAEWAQFPTLPQIWVKGELIGGSDIVLEMVESGELKEMLGETQG